VRGTRTSLGEQIPYLPRWGGEPHPRLAHQGAGSGVGGAARIAAAPAHRPAHRRHRRGNCWHPHRIGRGQSLQLRDTHPGRPGRLPLGAPVAGGGAPDLAQRGWALLLLCRIAVEPRPYQLVPLLLALQQDPVRLLIADDVGIGKTVEALLIARELWDRGESGLRAVSPGPHRGLGAARANPRRHPPRRGSHPHLSGWWG